MPRGLANKTIELIRTSRLILEEIHPATVRSVCYQLFAIYHLIPNMKKNSTNRVSSALVTARENGWIPWEWIVDEGRAIERTPGWDDPMAFTDAIRQSYRKDWWKTKPKHLILLSEKGTRRECCDPFLKSGASPLSCYTALAQPQLFRTWHLQVLKTQGIPTGCTSATTTPAVCTCRKWMRPTD